MNRRELIAAGAGVVGLAFAAGTARAADITVEEFCHAGPGDPPPPDPAPLPPRQNLGKKNLTFTNEPGVVIENVKLQGRIVLTGCPDARIKNVEVFGQHKGKWGNILVLNSPGTSVTDTDSHDNPSGHSIFFDGDCNHIFVARFKGWNLQEDGFAINNGASGLITIMESDIWGAAENAIDQKSAKLVVHGGTLKTSGLGNAVEGPGEVVLVHNSAVDCQLIGVTLIDTTISKQKALLRNTLEGAEVTAKNCLYDLDRSENWFWIGGQRFGAADLGNPFSLDVEGLTVTGGQRV